MLAWSVDEAECSIRRNNALKFESESSYKPKRKRIDTRSRQHKTQLQLNKAASSSGQSRIPEYFKVLNEIQILAAKNRRLEEALHVIYKDLEITSTTSLKSNASITSSSSLLNLLVSSAQKNGGRAKNSYRHDATVKMFIAYIKMLGGSLMYETLHANLPICIPSPSIINKYIAKDFSEATSY